MSWSAGWRQQPHHVGRVPSAVLRFPQGRAHAGSVQKAWSSGLKRPACMDMWFWFQVSHRLPTKPCLKILVVFGKRMRGCWGSRINDVGRASINDKLPKTICNLHAAICFDNRDHGHQLRQSFVHGTGIPAHFNSTALRIDQSAGSSVAGTVPGPPHDQHFAAAALRGSASLKGSCSELRQIPKAVSSIAQTARRRIPVRQGQ